MKRTLVSTLVLTAAMCGQVVNGGTLDFLQQADTSNIYLGFQLYNGDLDGVEGVGQDMSVLNATLGYTLKAGISVEARYGAGSDQLDSLVQDPVSSYIAGLVRYHYTWDNIMVYAGAGMGVRGHSSVLEGVDDRQIGVTVSFGVNLFGNDKSAVNLEYFTISGDERYSAIGFGYHHYFGNY
jgi:hypothetical protein